MEYKVRQKFCSTISLFAAMTSPVPATLNAATALVPISEEEMALLVD